MTKRELIVCALLGTMLAAAPVAVAQDGTSPASQPTATETAPRLEITPTEVDFGEVWHGANPVGEVTLKNTGTAPLEITKIKPGCGCTTVNKPKSRLAPGESDVLRIEYRSGKKRAGKINRSVSIRTNDPEQPIARVRLIGEIKELVKGSPSESISFGQLTGDETVTKSIELTVTYEKELFLKLKEPAAGPFKLELEELEPGARYKLSATSKPPLSKGVPLMKAVLLTGLKEIPEVPFDVRAIVRPRVAVSHPRLYVPAKLNRPMTRKLRVNYLRTRPIRITKIESDCEKVTAELDAARADATVGRFAYHGISVNLPPGGELPESGAKLFIYTDDPDERYAKLVVEITNRLPSRQGSAAGMRSQQALGRRAKPPGKPNPGKPESGESGQDKPLDPPEKP